MIGDSREIPSRRVEMATARASPKTTPRQVDNTRSTTNSPNGDVERPLALDHEGGEREGEDRAGNVVERRLRDDRLRHLRSDAEALEERDEDRRIRRCENRADQQARFEREVEGDRGDGAGHERGDHDSRDRQESEAERDRSKDREREPEPSVEEDHRDAECQEQLDADRVERQVERVQGIGSEQRSRGDEHDHARNAEEARDELGDEAGSEQDRQRLDDVSCRHGWDSPLCR